MDIERVRIQKSKQGFTVWFQHRDAQGRLVWSVGQASTAVEASAGALEVVETRTNEPGTT